MAPPLPTVHVQICKHVCGDLAPVRMGAEPERRREPHQHVRAPVGAMRMVNGEAADPARMPVEADEHHIDVRHSQREDRDRRIDNEMW